MTTGRINQVTFLLAAASSVANPNPPEGERERGRTKAEPTSPGGAKPSEA
jgi:hypothetical protein